VLKVPKVHKVEVVQQEPKELKVEVVQLVRQGFQDQQALKELQDQQDLHLTED
jgi:Zn ribbon nucleic-acid-binding protein